MSAFRNFALASTVVLGCLWAAPAQATWQLYVSGGFGYSIAKGKVSGSAQAPDPGEMFRGKDKDVSPLVGGAFGVEVPMNELTPWRLPYDLRLPDWPVRFEFEASGLRDYELKTDGLFAGGPESDPFRTDINGWSFMQNLWFDVPLRGLFRPISATSGFLFGKPRLPRLRRFLGPLTTYVGVGIGFAHLKIKTEEPGFRGKKSKFDFAYQFGTGLAYQLTDAVNLGLGYRYHKPAKMKLGLADPADRPGTSKSSEDIHEIRFEIRIRVFDLPYPWR